MLTLLLTIAVAFVVTLAATPPLRQALRRVGFVDRDDSNASSRAGVPRMGGIAVLAGATVGIAVPYLFHTNAMALVRASAPVLSHLALPVALVAMVGIADDAFGVSPRCKLFVQALAALLLVAHGIRISSLLGYGLPLWLSALATVAWLLACSNAFNLIDGVDGLATGIALFAAITVFAFALISGRIELALITAAIVGALAGFLHFNLYPASIYLGDTGSLSLGFILGALALIWMDKATTFIGLAAPLFSLAIPLADTGIAILRRWLAGAPLFTGDRQHIHHRLLGRGLSVHRTVLLLYGLACGGAIVSLLLSNFRQQTFSGIAVLVFVVIGWSGIQRLGYVEFTEATRVWRRGFVENRRVIGSQVRLRALADRVVAAPSPEHLWGTVVEASRALHFTACELRLGGECQPLWYRRAHLSDADFSSADVGEAQGSAAAMPAGWSLRVPLGASGELGLISFWHGSGAAFPIAIQHLMDTLIAAIAKRGRHFLAASAQQVDPLPAQPALPQADRLAAPIVAGAAAGR